MTETAKHTEAAEGAELLYYLRTHSNWGRWGSEDQRGAQNLISDEHRVAAAHLVKKGQAISLGRPLQWQPNCTNPIVPEHQLRRSDKGEFLRVTSDQFSFETHGFSVTHLDALAHVWHVEDGIWGGLPEDQVFGKDRASWGDLSGWANGLFTRGVLVDIPGLRNVEHVEPGTPVRGSELAEACERQGVRVHAGDALVVYSGRERWEQENPQYTKDLPRPGLHPSCVQYIRESDVAALCWDCHEQFPTTADLPLTVHLVLPYFGVALIDNASLGALAEACRMADTYEFLFTLAPLHAPGATGCPVNPIAIL